MKRSEMVKKLHNHLLDIGIVPYDLTAHDILSFLQAEGMAYTVRYLHKDDIAFSPWDPEEETPKLPQKGAVKRLRNRYNARRQSIKPSKELRKALKVKKK